jgi:predicted Zn finger-like uncharacterized protein
MANSSVVLFNCPSCGAKYKIIAVESEAGSADRQIGCRNCGASVEGREGRFILKYFLVDRPNFKASVRHSSVRK